jgi:hypothetical protein
LEPLASGNLCVILSRAAGAATNRVTFGRTAALLRHAILRFAQDDIRWEGRAVPGTIAA